jgi:hypothetical protein
MMALGGSIPTVTMNGAAVGAEAVVRVMIAGKAAVQVAGETETERRAEMVASGAAASHVTAIGDSCMLCYKHHRRSC